MQLMPATAKRAAASLKLGYRPGDLTAKPQYNMQLGMATISDYLDQWGGSYVLAIAAYNAGSTNVRKWVETFGDPRDPGVDAVDWIESIPFGETRNYVQRVIENINVYRNRLSGRDQKLAILADVYGPSVPKPPVLKYDPPRPVEAPRAGGQASATP
jgi:soluble lytic murein transglycosylase